MSNWYDEAQKRLEQQKQQEEADRLCQQQLAEQQRLHAQQQLQQKYNELRPILDAIGIRQKLEYIRQNIWRCGQIEPYQKDTDKYYIVGLRLHFEYDKLSFGFIGGRQVVKSRSNFWYEGGRPELISYTETISLEISVGESKEDKSRYLWSNWGGLHLEIQPGNLAIITEKLEEMLFLIFQNAESPLLAKAEQDQKNREEERKYRDYLASQKKPKKGWFG